MGIKVAFTGTGYINKIHARACLTAGNAELVGVVNHRPESRENFAAEFTIPTQADSVEELLAKTRVDALIVSTPNYLHATETIRALEAGIHVMVEKPMAMTAAEAAEMIAAGNGSGALLMVAHCWRFDEEVLWLRDQVAEGRLGPIIRTKGYGVHSNWGPGGWFTQAKFAGGGAMADMGIHALDTVRFLLGDPLPQSVYARIGTHYGNFDVDDTGVIIVNWQGGVTSYLESGWWQPHSDGPEAATQLYGKKGFGSVYPTLLKLPNPAAKRVDEVNPGFAYPRKDHAPQTMYDAQVAHFFECIENGSRPNPGGHEGWVNMLVVDAAYESARTGKVVEIKIQEGV